MEDYDPATWQERPIPLQAYCFQVYCSSVFVYRKLELSWSKLQEMQLAHSKEGQHVKPWKSSQTLCVLRHKLPCSPMNRSTGNDIKRGKEKAHLDVKLLSNLLWRLPCKRKHIVSTYSSTTAHLERLFVKHGMPAALQCQPVTKEE
jgi:hypothetical protein